MSQNAMIGVDTGAVADINETLETAVGWKSNFICAPLVHPRYRADKPRKEPFTRSDLTLDSGRWSQQVLGKLSAWLQMDSADDSFRRQSEEAFKQEIAWASHLTLQAVLLPAPGARGINYGHCVNQAALANPHLQFWVKVPLSSPLTTPTAGSGEDSVSSGTGGWKSQCAICAVVVLQGVSVRLPLLGLSC